MNRDCAKPSVGKPLPHESALLHVTGTAAYIDDLPQIAGQLHVDFVGSAIAAGKIKRIAIERARAIKGIAAVLTHADLPAHQNRFGPIFRDEPFLASDTVMYIGQPIVVIAAEDPEVVRLARAAVVIEYEPQQAILTIDEAVAAESYIGPKRTIGRGDLESAFAKAPHKLAGTFRSGGQEQLYFESQACIAIPGEAGAIEIISSTQNPTETQAVVAEALGLSMHQVVCQCKRMGGGFGGKETQSAIPAVMAAWVATVTGRSARVVYDKDRDMIVTGKRHEYQTAYQIAFDDSGRLLGVIADFLNNGGAYADLSTSVLERSMMHLDNAYYLPAVAISGQVCRLNYPPNTAFRGFGGPQGVAVIENGLQDIARFLGKDAWDIRRLNLYRDGDATANTTPYGQLVVDHLLVETWDELAGSSDYRKRVAGVQRFNAASHLFVKGIAMTPIKFGISFTTKFLNQGNALVNVYTDGSVQVSTGGTEMGQGLNTKIRQVVADAFGIGTDRVAVMPTSTEKNNNTSPTAASAGTDLNAQAALHACEQIRARMVAFAAVLLSDPNAGLTPSPSSIGLAGEQVYDDRNPNRRIDFAAFCDAARRERVDLGARGFYATPGVDFNRDTGRGNPYYYFTTGAAVSEVTIDRFTGELTVDRVDMLMDIGKSINPGVDRGQLIGGFIQGMGWCTHEQLVYDASGRLLSTSPTTYKIPNITDVPTIFNVATIDNPKHQMNVYRSKAVGEPPLMLGISVWAAVKHALGFLRVGEVFDLPIPATGEAILGVIESAKTSVCVSDKLAP